MTSLKAIEDQLKALGFNVKGWGRTEVRELANIILPDEIIFECVNGIYEGGFALMLATDIRVLLVDKKPLNYLSLEDMRYELISEIDYSHRLVGAYITLSSGIKNLKFSSLNQPRLRKLIGHVQVCMADAKKREATHPHLEQINKQLQSYLLAQYEQQQRFHEQLKDVKTGQQLAETLRHQPEPVRPSAELSDYLFAQRLLEQHEAEQGQTAEAAAVEPVLEPLPPVRPEAIDQMAELYADGMQEVFGKPPLHPGGPEEPGAITHAVHKLAAARRTPEINPLHVAYSKLPLAMRNRRFGSPSFHDHSRSYLSTEF